jgi:hypothetical protein
MLKRLDSTSTRLGLTVRHRVGAIAGPTQLLVRTENNIGHLVLVLASWGTVGDAWIDISGCDFRGLLPWSRLQMIRTGFCRALARAGPRTSGWRIFCQSEVPRGVRPVRGQRGQFSISVE